MIERNSLKTPLECLRLQLKAQQRFCDREFAHYRRILEPLVQTPTDDDYEPSIHAILQELYSMKDTIQSMDAEETDFVIRLQERATHVHSPVSVQHTSSHVAWKDTRMKRLLADYMLYYGMMDVASDIVDQYHLNVCAFI